MNDLYTKSVTRLNDLLKESTFPFVRRGTLMRFTLWMQLIMGVHIRSVQRTRFADEIKRCLSQSENSAGSLTISPAASTGSLIRSPATSARASTGHSTPVTSYTRKSGSRDQVSRRQNSVRSVDRKRPASINKESDLVRDARLKRFDNTCHKKGTWSCQRCTLENNDDNKSCSACGDVSSTKQFPMSVRAETTWSCPQCTFQNKADESNCSVCCASKTPALAMSPHVASLSSTYRADDSNSPNSSIRSSKATPSKRCGACGREGHNRSNATEHNCQAYFDEKEIDRREKIRRKREETITQEREKIRAIEQE